MDDKSFNIRVPKRWVRVAMIVGATALIVAPLTAIASHSFTDVPDSNTFHSDIAWLADAGVTKGCNPPDNTEFCPDDDVSRGQMSAFMRRFSQYIGAEDGTPAQADNADTLDGLDSTDFVEEGEADSVSSSMTSNESGVSQTVESSFIGNNSSTFVSLASSEISVPSDGYVLVIGSAEIYVDHVNGTETNTEVGVSTEETSAADDQDKLWRLSSNAPSGSYTNTMTTQKVFPVDAGTHTFHLVGRSNATGNAADGDLTLVFLSTAYGTVEVSTQASGADEG